MEKLWRNLSISRGRTLHPGRRSLPSPSQPWPPVRCHRPLGLRWFWRDLWPTPWDCHGTMAFGGSNYDTPTIFGWIEKSGTRLTSRFFWTLPIIVDGSPTCCGGFGMVREDLYACYIVGKRSHKIDVQKSLDLGSFLCWIVFYPSWWFQSKYIKGIRSTRIMRKTHWCLSSPQNRKVMGRVWEF